MNEKRFKELLNEYLDGELSGTDLQAFKQALSESVHYRNLLRQYQCLDRMQAAACRRNPRLNFRLLPFGQVCRSGAMLMNASVLFLCVGLFQTQVPMGTNLPSAYFSSSDAPSASAAESRLTEAMTGELAEPPVSVVASARENGLAALPSAMSGTTTVALRETGLSPGAPKASGGASAARDAGEKVASTALVAPDFDGRLISDEYGFVLL